MMRLVVLVVGLAALASTTAHANRTSVAAGLARIDGDAAKLEAEIARDAPFAAHAVVRGITDRLHAFYDTTTAPGAHGYVTPNSGSVTDLHSSWTLLGETRRYGKSSQLSAQGTGDLVRVERSGNSTRIAQARFQELYPHDTIAHVSIESRPAGHGLYVVEETLGEVTRGFLFSSITGRRVELDQAELATFKLGDGKIGFAAEVAKKVNLGPVQGVLAKVRAVGHQIVDGHTRGAKKVDAYARAPRGGQERFELSRPYLRGDQAVRSAIRAKR